jgi:hypothetical protein
MFLLMRLWGQNRFTQQKHEALFEIYFIKSLRVFNVLHFHHAQMLKPGNSLTVCYKKLTNCTDQTIAKGLKRVLSHKWI